MKRAWKRFLKSVCRWILCKWFPWQYDLGAKLHNAPRQNIGNDLTAAHEQFLKSWKAQKQREKFVGKKLYGWLMKTGDRYFYPKVNGPIAQTKRATASTR